jgi:hypothetical protein
MGILGIEGGKIAAHVNEVGLHVVSSK